MSRKKISTTIYLTPEQSERLRLLHERTKVPVAVYIREGIGLLFFVSTATCFLGSSRSRRSNPPHRRRRRRQRPTRLARMRSRRRPPSVRSVGTDPGPVESMLERAAGGAGGKS